jgi:predicted O-methyltransferase YrrM
VAELVDPEVEAYAEAHTTPLPDYLRTVHADTKERFPDWWGMMVGRLEGRFLELLVFATGARHVLEIGTFTGFSAIAMAAGLPDGGRITTLEASHEHAEVARTNIGRSPHAGRIEVIEGPAIDSLRSLPGPFDFVFIDADKVSYDAYYEAVLPKLTARGLIAVDNTLQRGAVLGSDGGENVAAVRAFNDKVVADSRVVCDFTTVRDGVTLIRLAGG